MIALIPVKPLALGKSRLAGALDPPARIRLVHDSLRHTIETLRQAPSISRIIVVTRDAQVSDWAAGWGASVLRETRPGLNESLTEAREQLPAADALLIVPADLAWLAAEDVQAMIALLGEGPGVVIAPDRRGRGTNALLLRPPGVIDFHFGPDSAREHSAQAEARGITPCYYRSGSTSLDVDEPDDLSLYHAAPYVW